MENRIKISFLQVVEKAISVKKMSNLQQFQKEYIGYSPEWNKGVPFETNGYSSMEVAFDKILRIPFSYFMSIEICQISELGVGYHLCTYVPCRLPICQKCGVFQSSSEDGKLHRHDYFEMIYVYKGRRTTQVENQEVVIEEKELCIFDMQCAHLDIRMKSEGIAFYCCFTNKQVDSYFLNNLDNKYMREFFLQRSEQKSNVSYLKLKADTKMTGTIEANFEHIFYEMEKAEAGFERMAQMYTMRICNGFKNNMASDVVVFSKRLRGTRLFQAVAKFISSNIADISLDKLCDEFHYQTDYYTRLIKKNTGLTYSEYVCQLRMEKAKNLLINTDMSVKEIMSYLGYQSHSYFYKSFQKEMGMTPVDFRKQKNHKS